MVFNVFGSRDLPRDPQETQEPPKKHPKSSKGPKKSPKKSSNKCLRGKKCLKPAISILTNSGTNFRIQICTFFKHFLHMLFTTFQKNVETHFGDHFGIRAAQEGQDEPKRAIRSFKEPKTFIFKNLKNQLVFMGFWLQRPLKKASRGPRWLPKGTQKIQDPKKQESKIEPKNYKKNLNQFWSPL